MYDWVNNYSECPLCLPDIAKSSKGCLHLSRFSSAIISSIKNKVLDLAKGLLIFSIQSNKQFARLYQDDVRIGPKPFSTPVRFIMS